MKKKKRKRKVKGYSQAVRWDPELCLRQLGVKKLAWQRAETATGIKLANKKLCSVIKKRLLRRWKETPLQVRTLLEMGYQMKVWKFKWVTFSNSSISTSAEPPALIERLSCNFSTL